MGFVSCPFDPTHRMLPENLQRHVIKCMTKHPNYVPCVYNALHRFKTKEEMLQHAVTCPEQRNNYHQIETIRYQSNLAKEFEEIITENNTDDNLPW